jgi:LIVCS family branched-chain amino acid:cation transporter
VFVTLIFSIPDFLGALHLGDFLKPITYWIPLSSKSLGWVLPALLMFIGLNVYNQQQKRESREASLS